VQQSLLQRPLVLVEQRDGDRRPVGEAAVEGSLADAGGAGDVLHGHLVGAVAVEELAGGVQDTLAVAGGVHPRAPGRRRRPARRVALIQATGP
jgi:hypothetical protein